MLRCLRMHERSRLAVMSDGFSGQGLTATTRDQRSPARPSLGVERWRRRGAVLFNVCRGQGHGLVQRRKPKALLQQAQGAQGWHLTGSRRPWPGRPHRLRSPGSDSSVAWISPFIGRSRLRRDGLKLMDQANVLVISESPMISAWPGAGATPAMPFTPLCPPPHVVVGVCNWIYACRASPATKKCKCCMHSGVAKAHEGCVCNANLQ